MPTSSLMDHRRGSYDKEKGSRAAAVVLNTNKSFLNATGKAILHSNHECKNLGILAAFKLMATVGSNEFHWYNIFTDNKGAILRMKNLF